MNAKAAYRTIIPREYASTKEVVGRLIDQAGGTKRAAFELGLGGPTSVQAYSDPSTRTQITYDQVRRLTSPANAVAAEDLAARAGGIFLPGGNAPSEAFAALAGTCMSECAEFAKAVLTGHADGKPDASERAQCLRELDDALRVLAAARLKLINQED